MAEELSKFNDSIEEQVLTRLLVLSRMISDGPLKEGIVQGALDALEKLIIEFLERLVTEGKLGKIIGFLLNKQGASEQA